MKKSLRLRLTLAAIIMMAVFMSIAGLAINRLYSDHALHSQKALLQSQLYALLALAQDDSEGRLSMPANLADPRFNLPMSGLYAGVSGSQWQWRSASAASFPAFDQFINAVNTGQSHYLLTENYLVFNYGIAWEDLQGQNWSYTITLISDLDNFKQQIQKFRNNLWIWLGGSLLVLLAVQFVLMYWGLKPLKRLMNEVRQIELGQQQQLSSDYPQELQSLTENLNSLITHSQAAQNRYRQSLGDLAHSLKTPLALLRGARNQSTQRLQAELDEQLPHIDRMMQYHLQKAAMMGQTGMAQAVSIISVAEKIASSLDKVYQSRQLLIELEIDENAVFYGDQTDLLELLGNLMDNACKHARQRVLVSVTQSAEKLSVTVEDDGPGIAQGQWQQLIQRGRRADEKSPGHGLGLSIVMELIHLYEGEIHYADSVLGGALISLHFTNE